MKPGTATVFLVGYDDLGMQMANYQETCIMTAKFNNLNKEINILEHIK